MKVGHLSRKLGLGSEGPFSSYSNLEDLIDGELSKKLTFMGVPKRAGEIENWPDRLTYNLDERIDKISSYWIEREALEYEMEKLKLSKNERRLRRSVLSDKYSMKKIDKYKFFHSGSFGDAQIKLRLSYFWLNHFTVGDVRETRELIGNFWESTIVNGLEGTFSDLLYYSTCHPAMLDYLDNIFNNKHGINDNLARELLELHSVSPSLKYTENDIHNAAKVLAGWGMTEKDRRKIKDLDWREPWLKTKAISGDKKVLGKTIPDGKSGLRTLTDFLSGHSNTIRHISSKLLRHFVGESFTDLDLQKVTEVWESSNGNLPKIHKAVLTIAAQSNKKSFTWPLIWSFQVLRSSSSRLVFGYDEAGLAGSKIIRPKNEMGYNLNYIADCEMLMQEMGQCFWSKRQPNGFSDKRKDWISSEYLDRRIRFAGLVFDFGQPGRSSIEIMDLHNVSGDLRNKLLQIKDDRERFIALFCSPEFLEA